MNNCKEAEKLAEMLKEYGLQYGDSIPKDAIKYAKENSLVIVTGASDDLIEFAGAIDDEGSCFDGGTVFFDDECISQDDISHKKYSIEAIWGPKNEKGETVAAWKYKARFPLYEFPVMENREIYCIGAVFSLKNLKNNN